MRLRFALWLAGATIACGSDPAAEGTPQTDAGMAGDAAVSDGAWPDANGGATSDGGGGTGGTAGAAGAAADAASPEPCPTLAVPTSCFGREVMFREVHR